MQTVKCTAVGDEGVGKTSMIITYATKRFPMDFLPTVSDNYAVNFIGSKELCQLSLFDTAGQEEYDYLRTQIYPATDIFLICFSVASRSSFENVKRKWVPEIHHYCPRTPIVVLVVTQNDLRSDPQTISRLSRSKQSFISEDEAKKLAKQINAFTYIECSALSQKGLEKVFNETVHATFSKPNDDKKKSTISRICSLLHL